MRDTMIWGVWVVAGASVGLAYSDIVDNAGFGIAADAGIARILGTEISGGQMRARHSRRLDPRSRPHGDR